jgi:protein-S-isoprenylcysteine O-methyltransferase Ste14
MNDATRRHLQSFVLPISATLIIPGALLWSTRHATSFWGIHAYNPPAQIVLGMLLIAVGAVLLFTCIRLFAKLGKGTLAPWNPTQNLVISGVYAHTRNPMISGVGFILLGESVVFGSGVNLVWFLCFILGNTIYFILVEERSLAKRFGEDYAEYKENVPRWIPRITPWRKQIQR